MMAKTKPTKQVKPRATKTAYSFFDVLIQSVKSKQIKPNVAILEAIEQVVQRLDRIQSGMETEAQQIRDELSALKDAIDKR